LDEKIKREGFDKVLREDLLKRDESNTQIEQKMPNFEPKFFSQGQSYIIRRIHRPDGVSLHKKEK
jgi:hypothetical protein